LLAVFLTVNSTVVCNIMFLCYSAGPHLNKHIWCWTKVAALSAEYYAHGKSKY